MGRLAFGAGLIAGPDRLGGVLVGKAARKPMARTLFRFYGTRDVVLGFGALRAAARDRDIAPWLAGGIAADVLDVAVMATEWSVLPQGKRLPGVATALGAAVTGAVLLARR